MKLGLCGAVALLLSAAAQAGTVDWAPYADERTVTVITRNEDGSNRETTIWLVVVGDHGFIRTGGSRWGKNIARDPDLTLRIDDAELALRAEFVEDEATRERVIRALREKYGFMDWLISPFRGRHPKIMRLAPRSGS